MRITLRQLSRVFIAAAVIGLATRTVEAIPSWVKDAVAIKTSGMHSDAIAVTLTQRVEVNIATSGASKWSVRVAHKILAREGIQWAALREYTPAWRRIGSVKGWRIAPTEEIFELSNKNKVVFAESDDGYSDGRFYVNGFPDAKPGDVVAYEYELTIDDWTSQTQTFVFQRGQPVVEVEYRLIVPTGWQTHVVGWRDSVVTVTHTEKAQVWTAHALSFEKEEPLSPPWQDYSRHVTVSAFDPTSVRDFNFNSWGDVSQWGASAEDGAILPDPSISAHAATLVTSATTDYEKLQKIGAFVRDNIRYVAVEVGDGRFIPRPAGQTLSNRYGDCKDKTALMRSLLRDTGIPSRAVLAGVARDISPDLPTPFQFDHCIVAVPRSIAPADIDLRDATVGQWLIFDPTDELAQLGSLNGSLQGKYVLVTGDSAGVVALPVSDPEKNRITYDGQVTLDSLGDARVTLTLSFVGSAAREIRFAKKSMDKVAFLATFERHLLSGIPGGFLKKIDLEGADDSCYCQIQFDAPNYLTRVGDRALLKLDPFRKEQPPALTAPRRSSPIWFGESEIIRTSVHWRFAGKRRVISDSLTGTASCPGASLHYSLTSTGREYLYSSTITHTGHIVSPAEYESAKSYSKAQAALLALRTELISQ